MHYISHFRLTNIRGFKEFELNLMGENDEIRKRTLIIGKNGTGKTTLLRCIAIGLCNKEDGNALLAEDIGNLINEEEDKEQITINLQSSADPTNKFPIETYLNRNGNEIISRQSSNIPKEDLLICGYGVGRAVEGPVPTRPYRIVDSTYSLFNYESYITEIELSLRRLEDFQGKELFKKTMQGIKRVLDMDDRHSFVYPPGGGVFISGPGIGENIPIQGWADGYRKTFAWILDLYS